MLRGISLQNWRSAAVCAAMAAAALGLYLQWSWKLIPAAAVLVLPGAVWYACSDRRTLRFAAAFGFLFSLLQIFGARMDIHGTIASHQMELAGSLATALTLTPGAGGLFVLFTRAVRRAQLRGDTRPEPEHSHRIVFWGSAALLMACWLPYLLAFYPGLFTYDISWQYQQYQTWSLNAHHPLLHTLLVGWFCDFGRMLFGYPAKGLLMYTLFQMSLMAMAMSSAIGLLYKHRAPAWVCLCLLFVDAVLPFNTLLVISSTKDTLFSGAVLYLGVLLAEAVLDRERLREPGWGIRFVLTGTAVGLMRNNGFICLAAVAVVCLLGMRRYRKPARRLLAFALGALTACSAVGEGIKTATDAEDGHFREMLSVPLQQLARVYSLTDDRAKSEIEEWLPTVELYSPDLADLVKNTFEGEKEDLPELFRLWAEVGLRHPIIYADSILATCEGLYRIGAEPTGQYLETDFHENEGWWLLEDSKWPALHEGMADLYSRNEYRNIPLLDVLLSPALWAWLMVLSLWTGVYMRRREVVLVGTSAFALYITVLLGPCVMVRYIYPIMLTAPLLLGLLTLPEKNP